MSYSNPSLLRCTPSLPSMLLTLLLACAALGSFQLNAAVISGGAENTDSTEVHLRGRGRDLLDTPPPIDFYNAACERECLGEEKDEELFAFLNACPKCPEQYEKEHCNHCCYDGASSLRIRWHGCHGTISFASEQDGEDLCELEAQDRSPTDGVRFVDCACYAEHNTPETFDESACQLFTCITFTSTHVGDADICIVSIMEVDGVGAVMDLTKPLPAIIGLVHTAPNGEDDPISSTWNPYPIKTFFDTTCDIIDKEEAPYVLPLFPGYGKVPNTCPEKGFFDLGWTHKPPLPEDLDKCEGESSVEPFWYEFIDGTSTGFWPVASEEEDGGSVYFIPTFATCACVDCDPTLPTVCEEGENGNDCICSDEREFIACHLVASSECEFKDTDGNPNGNPCIYDGSRRLESREDIEAEMNRHLDISKKLQLVILNGKDGEDGEGRKNRYSRKESKNRKDRGEGKDGPMHPQTPKGPPPTKAPTPEKTTKAPTPERTTKAPAPDATKAISPELPQSTKAPAPEETTQAESLGEEFLLSDPNEMYVSRAAAEAGAKAPLDYTVFSVAAITVGLFLLVNWVVNQLDTFVNWVGNKLDTFASSRPLTARVLLHTYRELANVGEVELVVFLLHKYYSKLNIQQELVFADVHFTLFFTALFNATRTLAMGFLCLYLARKMWVQSEETVSPEEYSKIQEECTSLRPLFQDNSMMQAIKHPCQYHRYRTLTAKLGCYDRRQSFLDRNTLPAALQVSEYLSRSLLDIMAGMVHISSFTWFALAGVFIFVYVLMGIVVWQTQDLKWVGVWLTVIFFVAIAVFVATSIIIFRRMKTVYDATMRLGRQAQRSEDQGSKGPSVSKLIPVAVQVMQSGFSVAWATVLVFGKEIFVRYAPVPGWAVVVALFVCDSVFALICTHVLVRYTVCTSLGPMVNENALSKTKGSLQLAQFKRDLGSGGASSPLSDNTSGAATDFTLLESPTTSDSSEVGTSTSTSKLPKPVDESRTYVWNQAGPTEQVERHSDGSVGGSQKPFGEIDSPDCISASSHSNVAEPEPVASFSKTARAYFLSGKYKMNSFVFGTMAVLLYVGMRIEAFNIKTCAMPNNGNTWNMNLATGFWMETAWLSCFIAFDLVIIALFLRGQVFRKKERVIRLSGILDLVLSGICLMLLMMAQSRRCCDKDTEIRLLANEATCYEAEADCCPEFAKRFFGGVGRIEPCTAIIALRVLRFKLAEILLTWWDGRRDKTPGELEGQELRGDRKDTKLEKILHEKMFELWMDAQRLYPEIVEKNGPFSGQFLQAMLGVGNTAGPASSSSTGEQTSQEISTELALALAQSKNADTPSDDPSTPAQNGVLMLPVSTTSTSAPASLDLSSQSRKHASGLANLGNTCFMNSTLQCLAHTDPLRRYFLSGEFQDDLNTQNPLGTGGDLATNFASLLQEMWKSSPSLYDVADPRSFKAALGKHAEEFLGDDQHDSQEFATYFLDSLHEDTNRVTKKPYVEKLEQKEDETDDMAADTAWRLHLKREDSRVLEYFMGQVKSGVQCPTEGCGRVSTTFDPFMYLSVPIRGTSDRALRITFCPLAHKNVNMTITLNKTAPISVLLKKVVEQWKTLTGQDLRQEDLTAIDFWWNKRAWTVHKLNEHVNKIRDTDTTFVYQLTSLEEIKAQIKNDSNDKSTVLSTTKYKYGVLIEVRMEKPVVRQHESSSTEEFSNPLILRVAPDITVYGLREELAKRLSSYFKPAAGTASSLLEEDDDTNALISEVDSDENRQSSDTMIQPPAAAAAAAAAAGFGSPELLIMRQIPLTYEPKTFDGYTETTTNGKHQLGMLEKPGAMEGHPVSFATSDDDAEQQLIADLVGEFGTVFVHWTTELYDRSFDYEAFENAEDARPGEQDRGFRPRQSSQKAVTVLDCIDQYCQTEQLDESEMWYCDRCKDHVRARKQLHLYRTPPILIVHLKRFHSATTHPRHKIDTFIDFPLTGLDLTGRVMNWTEEEKPVYDCYAVSNNFGGLGGGHYTAHALDDDGKWCCFDDSHVTTDVDPKEVVSAAAYVLYYRRRDVVWDGVDGLRPPPMPSIVHDSYVQSDPAVYEGSA